MGIIYSKCYNGVIMVPGFADGFHQRFLHHPDDNLILADSSHSSLPSDEAYRQRMSLPSYRFSTLCYECNPNARHFCDKIFIKAQFCWGKFCLFCHMTSVGWLEIMIHHTPSIICDFHLPVDFRLDILFPHIFGFLHQNWVGIYGFTLTKLRHVGDKEKTIPSCLDTHSPILLHPFCRRAHSAL